jgi:hypothetical protein
MSFYQSSRQMKAAVIGSIIPWSGPLSGIPDGWIVCDGSLPDAKDYPLLVQTIGDTYNAGNSNLGGAFPAYTGQFKLPDLLSGRSLMDIEGAYFSAGGTGNAIDLDPDARGLIEPYIGSNSDLGVQQVYNDVITNVDFEIPSSQRDGYAGSISGNTIVPGEGEKVVYIGGRKLGHQHVSTHSHPGIYETVKATPKNKPGLGVIPYSNMSLKFSYASYDERQAGGGDGEVDEARFSLRGVYKEGFQFEGANQDISSLNSYSGFGSGDFGRMVGRANSENPPVNLSPQQLTHTPIANWGEFRPFPSTPVTGRPQIVADDVIQYGIGGQNIDIPQFQRNFYPDQTAAGAYSTFVSNDGNTFLDDKLQAHAHDPFVIEFDQGSLKPQTRINSVLSIPLDTELDNVSNAGALQINMNTSQPSLTCVYIIRAY